MPIDMVQNAGQQLGAFGTMAAQVEGKDDKFVFVKGNTIKTEGGFGHLFTKKSTNIATTQTLQNEVIAKYGKDVGDALAPTFNKFITSGKQLTLGTVKTILHAAEDLESTRLTRNTLELDKALEEKTHWNAETKGMAREAMLNVFKSFPKMTFTENNVSLEQMQVHIDCRNGQGARFHALQTPQEKQDFLQAEAYLALGHSPILSSTLVAESLPQMREAQGEGPLSLSVVWENALGTEMPDNIANKSTAQLRPIIEDQIEESIAEKGYSLGLNRATPARYTAVQMAPLLMEGMSSAAAAKATLGPLQHVSIKDFSAPPPVTSQPTVHTLEDAKTIFLKDFHRQQEPTSISVTLGETTHTTTNSTEGMSEEEIKQFHANKVTSNIQPLMTQLETLCKGNNAQLRTVMYAISQAGPVGFQKNLSETVGARTPMLEHAAMKYSFSADNNGNITFKADSPEGFEPVTLHSQYVIRPDGSSYAERIDMDLVEKHQK